MTRRKASLVPIVKAKARCSTYKKRKETLIKKTSELSKLCGEDACIIIYGPDSREPDVWPPREETLRILSRFSFAPELHRNRNMVDQNGFFSKQMEKLQVELRKVEEENCCLEARILLQDVAAGRSALSVVADAMGILRLSATVVTRLNELRERMNELLPVPQSVGPLEEVLLKAPLQLPINTDMALLSQEQEQCSSGRAGADVGSLLQGPYIDGFSSTGVASPVHDQYVVGLPSADVALPVQKHCMFPLASDDMPPLLDEELSLLSEEGYEVESADMEAMTLGSREEDEISQLFDWSCSGFEIEEILASI
jgi:SRF-type transcription factor (DNA-binding and dimerisation domain)